MKWWELISGAIAAVLLIAGGAAASGASIDEIELLKGVAAAAIGGLLLYFAIRQKFPSPSPTSANKKRNEFDYLDP